MRSLAALCIAFWVLVAMPTLCLAGAFAHCCGCDEATCPECQTQDCQKTHGCHDDPCPRDVTRLDQDDAGTVRLILDQATTTIDLALVDPASGSPSIFVNESLRPLLGNDTSPDQSCATTILPLLI